MFKREYQNMDRIADCCPVEGRQTQGQTDHSPPWSELNNPSKKVPCFAGSESVTDIIVV